MTGDRASGSHAGNTSDTSGVGSSAGKFEVPLPKSANLPPVFGAPDQVPAQNAPDRPDLLTAPARDGDLAGGPAADGPLTTSTAGGALAHGAHHIRPRPRHAG